MNDSSLVGEWIRRANKAKREAHQQLAKHEGATASRVILLEDLFKRLTSFPVDIQDYFREAIVCLENNLTRASIVLSWSGFFHVLAEKLYSENETALRKARAKWKFSSLEELKENYPEAQILDAAKEVGLLGKAKLKERQGQLAKRNQCAHPTLYKPSTNSAIGFVDEMLNQTKELL